MGGNKKLYLIGGGLVVFVLILFFYLVFGGGNKAPVAQRVNLKFWGVFEEQSAFQPSIDAFRHLYPNISVTYTLFNYADYESKLVEALAAGEGPDVLLIHNTWLAKQIAKLAPLPAQLTDANGQPLMTVANFKQQFAPVAEQDLIDQNKIYALPLYIDTLGLFYNKDILNSASIVRPPRTWEEFNTAVKQLTQIDAQQNITRAGAAIGTARNINRSTDILSLLFLQSGVPITDKTQARAKLNVDNNGENLGLRALRYYTDFADPGKAVYTWNDLQHYSIDAFTEGKAALMFNYQHQIAVLRAKAPRLNFGIAPLPQLDSAKRVNYANYWAVAVAKNSPNTLAAWQFANYLASRDGITPYLNVTLHPTARRDLLEAQKGDDENLATFDDQVLSATNWWQPDSVASEQILSELIDDVNFSRSTLEQALRTAEDKLNALIQGH